MYDVYINGYKRNGTFVSGWRNICSIPSNNDDGFEISSPSVKCSEDNADSFDFSIEMNSQYYDSLIPLKTLVRVKYGDDVIFYGRVLTIDNSSIYQTRRVHCEGAFAFLNDTYYEGIQEADKQKIDFSTYYRRIISNHNSKLLDQYSQKVINRGYITVDGTTTFVPTTEERKYEPSSWTQTSSLLSSLTREFGGHMLVHYRSGGLYLDWYKYYSRDLGVNRPLVSVGENIIDINTSASNIDKIFSYVTPIGDTGSNGKPVYLDGYTYIDKNGTSHTISGKSIPVSIVRDVYTDEQLTDEFHSASDYSSAVSNYGVIYKTQTFASAKNQEQLWNYTIKWIKDCYFGIASSFTIRAYDMHIFDQTKSRILVGDCVNVQYIIMENGIKTTKTKKLVCKAVSYDLFNPDNNSYTFGIPSEVLNRSYSEGRGKSGSEQAGGGGSGGGSGEEKDIELTFDGIAKWIQAAGGKSTIYGGNIAAQSFIDNGEVTGTAKVYDPESLPEGETIDQHKDLIFNATIAGRITATGQNIYVATNPTMGCFAFIGGRPTNLSGALPITFWYLRTGKKQTLNYTPPSLMYTEEEEQLINIMANWDINISSKDELNNVVNNFWVGLGDKAKGLKTQIWDPIQEKFVQPFKMAFEKAGSTIFGFLGLSGPNSKIRVSDDQTEDGSNGAELESETFTFGTFLENLLHPKVQLDGGNSQVKAGFDEQGNWKSVMNASITWTDEHGQQHTTDGFVKAMDFAVPEVPSFKTKFIAVDQLVANKATIEQLNSQIARIDSLESDSITVRNMHSKNVTFNTINGSRINCNEVNAQSHLILPNGVYLEAQGVWQVQLVNNNDGTYTLKELKLNGDERTIGTFNRAGGSILHWNWSTGTYTVLDENDRVVLSTTLQAVSPVPDSSVQKTGKVVYRPYQVMYGADEEHLYSTGKTSTISMDASAVFDDGWARALRDCEFPDLGTDATINVKLPNADEVEGTPRLREYTLSVDDNYAYLKRTDSGMSATAARVENPAYQRGKDAIKLALSWSDQNDTGTVSKVTSGSTKNSISFVVSASADIEYNSSTHKYTAKSQGKIDGTARGEEGSKTGGTEAYDAGISDGKNAVGLSIDTRLAQIKPNISSSDVKSVQIALNLGSVGSDGKRTVKVTTNGADLLTNILSDYANGKSDGQADAGLELDTTNKKVKRSLSSSVKEYTITADASISYDSSTHKYTAGAQSKAGTTNMQYSSKVSGTEAYEDGQAAAGLELDTTNKKVKRSLSSSVKEYTITADASISYDSSTHKYTAGAQSKAGTTKMQYNSKVSGTEAYDDGVSDGYKSGFDADHNPRITYGSGGSCNGDFEMAKAVKAHSSKTNGSTQESAGYWYVPGCHLVQAINPSSYISELPFDTYWEVVGVNHDGSQQHFGKIWKTPPNGYDEAARAMKYPSAISGQTTKATIYITHPKVGGGTEQYSLTLKKDSGGAYIMHNSVLLARVT